MEVDREIEEDKMPANTSRIKNRQPEQTSNEQVRCIRRPPTTELNLIESGTPGKEGGRLISRLRDDIQREHEACQAAAASAVVHAIAAGRGLVAAKSLVGHGGFGGWLAENFSRETGLTERTAQRYMRIARCVEQLLQHARKERLEQDPTSGSDLADREIMKGYTISRALKVIADNSPHGNKGKHRMPAPTSIVLHNEWLTPDEIIAGAERFLGRIHVDPCAAEPCNVPAATRFTADEDGLGETCVWSGTVFLNPGQDGDISPWVDRALESFEENCVTRAVLVLPAVTDSPWAPKLVAFPHAFCRTRPVVQCCRPGTAEVGTLPHPVMLVGVAQSEAFPEFAEAFSDIADVFLPATSM